MWGGVKTTLSLESKTTLSLESFNQARSSFTYLPRSSRGGCHSETQILLFGSTHFQKAVTGFGMLPYSVTVYMSWKDRTGRKV